MRTLGDISQQIAALEKVEIETLDLDDWTGLVEVHADDWVIKVRTGTKIKDLAATLAEQRLALPLHFDPESPWVHGRHDRLIDLLNFNFPHVLEAEYGNWRDWVLGLTVVLADGMIAKSGSMVVKSVAGFDVHKLLVGARGQLGLIAEVTLRVRPLGIPSADYQRGPDTDVAWIQRVLPADFDQALANSAPIHLADPKTATIWHGPQRLEQIKRFRGDWLMNALGRSADPDPHPAVTQRTLDLFDPQRKWVIP